MKLSQLAIDTEAATEGRWFTFVKDVRFRIARMHNPKYTEKQARFALESGRELEADEVQNVVHRLAAQTILLEWEGLENEDGSPLEYSEEQAYEFLTNPEYADIANFVYNKAGQTALYRRTATQELAGN